MTLARRNTLRSKGNSTSTKLKDVTPESEKTSKLQIVTEQNLEPQRVKMKRGSTSGQTWEVDVSTEWIINLKNNQLDAL